MLAPGTVLQNRYRIARTLGVGGMGAVYLAQDMRLASRQIAVKEMIPDPTASPADQAQARQQFQLEASMLSSLDHLNLPKVSDSFTEGGNHYLVMDYVDGETLEDIMDRTTGSMPEGQIINWAIQLCNVLTYLHSRQPPVIFRDLKPGNIMVDQSGTVKLIDFGIARFFKPGKKTDTLKMGTMGYAPPEQYVGKGQTDARSDIYSLGATLHHLLTGRDPTEHPPFSFDSAPPRSLNPAISPHIEATIIKALAYDRAQRFQSASEMRRALLAPVGPAVSAAPPSAKPLPWTAIGRTCAVLAAIALVLLASSVVALISILRDTPTPTSVSSAPPTAAHTLPPGDTAVLGRVTDEPALPHTPTSPVPVETPLTPIPTSTSTQSPTPPHTPTPMHIFSEMVRIPAGSFIQGSTIDQVNDAHESCTRVDDKCWRSALDDELPQHEVYLDEFYIDKHEVTNAQYAECVKAGFCHPPSPMSSNTRSSYFHSPRYADYPVVHVTWYDADSYCRWAGGRLPAEAEWEKAARGADGRLWPWGNSFSRERSNFRREGVEPDTSDTTPVGSYPGGLSPYGAMDMVGNVWEWVADWYNESYYARSTGRNPEGPSSGEKKVIRGGSWNSNIGSARAASRASAPPANRYFDVGFRCAR